MLGELISIKLFRSSFYIFSFLLLASHLSNWIDHSPSCPMLFVSLAVALGSISLFNPFVSSAPLSNLDVSLASSLAKSSHCSQVISNSSAAMSSTSLGQVNGFTGQDLSRRFVIPYALPPTGSRRFQDPVPMSHFPTYVDS